MEKIEKMPKNNGLSKARLEKRALLSRLHLENQPHKVSNSERERRLLISFYRALQDFFLFIGWTSADIWKQKNMSQLTGELNKALPQWSENGKAVTFLCFKTAKSSARVAKGNGKLKERTFKGIQCFAIAPGGTKINRKVSKKIIAKLLKAGKDLSQTIGQR